MPIKMKLLIVKSLCTIFLLVSGLVYGHDLDNAHASDDTRPTEENFKHCTFEFNETTYFSHLPSNEPDRSIEDDDFCDLRLGTGKSRRLTSVSSVWISMLTQNKLNETIAYQGFYKDKSANWKFKGNHFWINFTGFKGLSFKEERSGNDLILIGRQIESGRDQANTPIVFEGVHILRITPSYLVSMDFPFDVDVSPSIRDDVVNDMVKLVESVRITTNP
jgi:hypothetical protein